MDDDDDDLLFWWKKSNKGLSIIGKSQTNNYGTICALKTHNGSHIGKRAAVWRHFITIINSFPRGKPPLLHGALTPEVNERWASLYLRRIERMDSQVSPLALKAIRFRHLYLENAPCPVSPFIHHRPYNVWKKYAAVSIIFHGCHRLSPPFVLEP